MMSRKEAPRPGLVRAALGGKIDNAEGAQALGISVRQFRRLKAAYRLRGLAGLQHGNRGRPSVRRLERSRRERVVELLTTTYAGFNDHHFTEKLREVEHIHLSRETVRRIRLAARLPAQRRRRAPRHRIRRPRQCRPGALVLVDGSEHRWLGDRHPQFTLQGAVDDATGQLLELVVRVDEDLHGYLQLLRGILLNHGLPLALYGDRFSALVRNDNHWTIEEELAGRQTPTQFGLILEELGVGFIAAQSPQAKGRIERMWAVLQDRLVAELRLGQIATLDETRGFLPQFITDYNHRFARIASSHESAWRTPPRELDQLLACRYQRVIARDNTLSLPHRWIQLPPRASGASWHGRRVEARELLDGRLRVLWQGRVIAEQAAPSLDFTLVPRSTAGCARQACFKSPPLPKAPVAPRPSRSRLVTPPRSRAKPGARWRNFKFGEPLLTGGT